MHYLQNFINHNHEPQVSNVEVAKITVQIKHQVFETRDKSAKIIQDNIISMFEEIYPYISLVNALHKIINYVKRLKMLS